mmetsp:Transcript_27027/g.88373  ORF Transcript_27027/g.88373 Transcript_27027/m.88373 type:complete len:424 (+) Transcript_27027:418-1689(+)
MPNSGKIVLTPDIEELVRERVLAETRALEVKFLIFLLAILLAFGAFTCLSWGRKVKRSHERERDFDGEASFDTKKRANENLQQLRNLKQLLRNQQALKDFQDEGLDEFVRNNLEELCAKRTSSNSTDKSSDSARGRAYDQPVEHSTRTVPDSPLRRMSAVPLMPDRHDGISLAPAERENAFRRMSTTNLTVHTEHQPVERTPSSSSGCTTRSDRMQSSPLQKPQKPPNIPPLRLHQIPPQNREGSFVMQREMMSGSGIWSNHHPEGNGVPHPMRRTSSSISPTRRMSQPSYDRSFNNEGSRSPVRSMQDGGRISPSRRMQAGKSSGTRFYASIVSREVRQRSPRMQANDSFNNLAGSENMYDNEGAKHEPEESESFANRGRQAYASQSNLSGYEEQAPAEESMPAPQVFRRKRSQGVDQHATS